MRLKNYIDETFTQRPRMDRGVTTKDKGHTHDFAVDHITGDGATGTNAGHSHKIRKFIVKPVENWKDKHIHKLK